jgi:hypothetical protein
MDERLKSIFKGYGGQYGGSGVASAPVVGNPNKGVTYFNPETNQHFTFDSGKVKFITPPAQSQNFAGKVGAVVSQSAHMAGQIATAGGKFVIHSVEDISKAAYHTAAALPEVGISAIKLQHVQQQSTALTNKMNQITKDYGAGKISKPDYDKRVNEIRKGFDDVDRANKEALAPALDARSHIGDVPETALNILALGKGKTIEAAGKTVANEGLSGVLTKVGQALETAASKVPAVRDLYARNAIDKAIQGESTAQAMARNSKQVAFGLLIKRPIFYQTNIGSAQDTYKDILNGNYPAALKDAAWLGAQTISGGPLGWAARQGNRAVGKIRELASGKNSFIDEISKKIGDGSPAQIVNYLNSLDKNSKEYKEAAKTLKIAQEVNLRATDDDSIRAAQAVTSHYEQHGIDLAQLSPQKLITDLNRWAQADEIARKISPKDSPTEYVAVRWDTKAKTAAANAVQEAGDDYQAMADAVSKISAQPGVGWGNNNILMAKIMSSIAHSGSAQEAAAAIKNIKTVSTLAKDIPEVEAKRLAKLGYSIAEPFGGRKTPKVDYKDTRKLVTAVSNGDKELFDEAVAPSPVVEMLASPLRKFGLSPENNTQVAYDKLSETLVNNLEQFHADNALGLVSGDKTTGGKFILSKLQEYVNKQGPNPYLNTLVAGRSHQSALQDIRQLNVKEIMEALQGTDKSTAKSLQKAIAKAYTDVPLEFRGLGVKAFDYAYRVPLFKEYSRIQSALRYTYNPFFRTQEVLEN